MFTVHSSFLRPYKILYYYMIRYYNLFKKNTTFFCHLTAPVIPDLFHKIYIPNTANRAVKMVYWCFNLYLGKGMRASSWLHQKTSIDSTKLSFGRSDWALNVNNMTLTFEKISQFFFFLVKIFFTYSLNKENHTHVIESHCLLYYNSHDRACTLG